jgi:peptidyl-prolyl cis-trans isomerase C
VARERQRLAMLEVAFADAAKLNSTCLTTKSEGGNLPAFPRYGSMIEPFAKAAYALRLFEISDIVATPVGYHLILVVGRKAGTPTKFDDPKVREAVKEVYEAKLKDAVLEQMKPRSKVEIVPMK